MTAGLTNSRRGGCVVILLVILAVLIGARRMLTMILGGEDAVAESVNLFKEERFLDHSGLTWTHIISATLFVVIALLQLSSTVRRRMPVYHRVAGRIGIASGIIAGITGIIMGIVIPIGGIAETLAMSFFGAMFLWSLIRAYRSASRRQFTSHKHWMIRAFAISTAIVTIRIIVATFIITRGFTGLSFAEFFGAAQWLGFSLHVLAAEWWIRRNPTSNTASV